MATTFSFSVDLETAVKLDQTSKAAKMTISAAMREAALDWIAKKTNSSPARPTWLPVPQDDSDVFDPASEPGADWSE